MNEFFGVALWQGLASTIFGVAFGIPAALWIDRHINRNRQKQEQAEEVAKRREKERQLLTVIKETLNSNRDLVLEIHRTFNPGVVLSKNVDTTLLDATASVKYEVVSNLELNILIDKIRYELEQLHRTVNMYQEMSFFAVDQQIPPAVSQMRVAAIGKHITDQWMIIVNTIGDVERLIDTELNRA